MNWLWWSRMGGIVSQITSNWTVGSTVCSEWQKEIISWGIFCEISLTQGLYSLSRRRLTGTGIPMINLRRSDDRLRFIMGIPILIRPWLYGMHCCIQDRVPLDGIRTSSEFTKKNCSVNCRKMSPRAISDCYTVLTWCQWDSQWGMRHGLQLAGISVFLLVGLNIGWDCLLSHWIWGSCDRWEFPPFCRGHWQSPCTALTAGKCLSLWLCKETVKEFEVIIISPLLLGSSKQDILRNF